MRVNLPKRLPYEAALIVALMLGSCSDGPKSEFTMKQRDEIRDLAAEISSQDRQRIAAIEERLKIDIGDDN